jgi:hypothetical protein
MRGDVWQSARFCVCFREGIRGVPNYYCEAATTEGRVTKKILKARDKKDADHRLRASGLRPMLIENFKTTKKKQKQKALHTRHIIRNTLAAVSGISLVGGVAAYLIILDINSIKSDKLTVKKLTTTGIVSGISPSVVQADTPEERTYGGEVLGILNTNYDDSFSGATLRKKTVIIIYVKEGRANFSDEILDSISTMVNYDFQREFGKSDCRVFINLSDEKSLAMSRYHNGTVTTEVY